MRSSLGRALVDLRVGLFADGGDDDGEPLRPRRIQQQKREPPVAGDEAELHCNTHALFGGNLFILKTPLFVVQTEHQGNRSSNRDCFSISFEREKSPLLYSGHRSSLKLVWSANNFH